MAESALTLQKILEENDIVKIKTLQKTIEKKLIAALHTIRPPKCSFMTKGIHDRDLFSEHHIPHHQTTKYGLGQSQFREADTYTNTGLIPLK